MVNDKICFIKIYVIQAIHENELYAAGPTYDGASLASFGSTATANSECLFVDDGAGVFKMNFNFKQCGTTHDETHDVTKLEYYNAIQAQEYYNEVILGVKE